MKAEGTVRRFVAGVLLVLLATGPVEVAAQENLPGKRWKLKYQAGSASFGEGEPVGVVVGKEVIQLRSDFNVEQAIRVADVKQITYDTGWGRYVSRALEMAPTKAESDTGMLLATAVTLPLALVTLPLKGKRHFVSIEWTEGRRHRAVMLRMWRSTAREFISELEKVTGLTARNLDREREDFKQEQKRRSETSSK